MKDSSGKVIIPNAIEDTPEDTKKKVVKVCAKCNEPILQGTVVDGML